MHSNNVIGQLKLCERKIQDVLLNPNVKTLTLRNSSHEGCSMYSATMSIGLDVITAPSNRKMFE